MYDITIIGAGIIGSFIARELARYDLKVLVLEKDNDISNGTTKANSAIIHGGYDANIVATFSGAFIFPFLIRLLWGKMCDNWGNIGGWMAAGFIVGTTWTLNHGMGMIFQTGGAWVDMAWAAGIGLFVASVLSGDNFAKGVRNYIVALIGGVLGGFILSCFM